MSTLAEDLERNVHEIIRNLMNNLASLGYEAGFELQTHPPTTTTEAAIKGDNFTASYIRSCHVRLHGKATHATNLPY